LKAANKSGSIPISIDATPSRMSTKLAADVKPYLNLQEREKQEMKKRKSNEEEEKGRGFEGGKVEKE
jgi:hypothetical protein